MIGPSSSGSESRFLMAASKCVHCGESVLKVVLGMASRGVDRRGPDHEVYLELDPEPNLKGANVLVHDDRCGYVTNWAAVRHYKIDVYRRHGLHCVNFGGLRWKGLE